MMGVVLMNCIIENHAPQLSRIFIVYCRDTSEKEVEHYIVISPMAILMIISLIDKLSLLYQGIVTWLGHYFLFSSEVSEFGVRVGHYHYPLLLKMIFNEL